MCQYRTLAPLKVLPHIETRLSGVDTQGIQYQSSTTCLTTLLNINGKREQYIGSKANNEHSGRARKSDRRPLSAARCPTYLMTL